MFLQGSLFSIASSSNFFWLVHNNSSIANSSYLHHPAGVPAIRDITPAKNQGVRRRLCLLNPESSSLGIGLTTLLVGVDTTAGLPCSSPRNRVVWLNLCGTYKSVQWKKDILLLLVWDGQAELGTPWTTGRSWCHPWCPAIDTRHQYPNSPDSHSRRL